MTKTIEINGRQETVTNCYSSGPGTPVHTYDLTGRRWVREIAGAWMLHEDGSWPRAVTVKVNV